MNKIIQSLHLYLGIGKHKWTFYAKWYNGNEKSGYKEDEYCFRCKKCGRIKRIKVVE